MPDVQMDYDMMDDMARLFRDGSQQLGDTIQAMQAIAGRLEDGALLGKGGDAFAQAIRNRLISRLGRLQDKLDELSGDVYGALVDLRDGDTEAASRFKG
jgi:WXG100 family type VII secretion target